MYDDLAIELAAARHGVVATWELRARGANGRNVEQIARSRQWEQASPTVWVRRGSPATTAQRVAISVLDAGPGVALSFLSGARWWGLTGCAQWPVEVVTAGRPPRRETSARVHRIRRLPRTWITELDGLPVVRPELLALQLFAACRPDRATRLVDSLWSRRVLSGPAIMCFLADMGAMGRNGTAGLREYIDARGPDYVPPATGLEARAWEILAGAGIQVRRQVDAGGEIAWTGRVDGLVLGTRVIVEVQSFRYHGALVDQEADDRRIKQLEADGFTVVEVTDDEVWSRPSEVVRKVEAGMALDRTRPSAL